MSDLISKAEVLETYADLFDVFDDSPEIRKELCKVYDKINKLPSAEPEIIRCRDCEHWDKSWANDWRPNCHYCPMIDRVCGKSWYCADAERRTDERFDRKKVWEAYSNRFCRNAGFSMWDKKKTMEMPVRMWKYIFCYYVEFT